MVNKDGALDYLLDIGFDGRLIVVKVGVIGQPLSTFAPTITGTCEQLVASWDKVTVRLRDNTSLLTVPVQPVNFAGTNSLPDGVEGCADLKDKPKPRLFGSCINMTPPCVNTSKLVYQLSGRGLSVIPVVYDGGVALMMEYFTTNAEDAAVKTLHELSPEIPITTVLANKADADAEAARILAMRKVRRDRLKVTVSMDALTYPAGGYWDNEAISEMLQGRYGHKPIHGGYAQTKTLMMLRRYPVLVGQSCLNMLVMVIPTAAPCGSLVLKPIMRLT